MNIQTESPEISNKCLILFQMQTPKLATGVFHTTYTYLNTFMDGELPLVVTSQHTVTNTITAPDDYLSLLQPSESATTAYETNTYYSTMALTKRLTDSDTFRIISTTDVVRQVVITESLPSKSTSVMTSYIAVDADSDKHNAIAAGTPLALLSTTDVVKTYYVTYTYFNTYLVNDSTIVRSNVSTSSDVVTEKLYLYPTKKATLPNKLSTVVQNDLAAPPSPSHESETDQSDQLQSPLKETINIYATKTYMTTYTYFTTLLQGPAKDDLASTDHISGTEKYSSTVVNSHTRVVENVITESIPMNYLPSSAVHNLHAILMNRNESHVDKLLPDGKYTTVATLIGGQAIEITAVKMPIDAANKVKATPTVAIPLFYETSNSIADTIESESNNLSNSEEYAESSESDENTDIKNDYEISNESNFNDMDASASGSNVVPNVEQAKPTKFQNKENSTKIIKNKNGSQVSNLIGSLNFDGLKALGPMFNAVAGLINNNFGLKWGNNTNTKSRLPLPPQSASLTLLPTRLSTYETTTNANITNYKNTKSRDRFPTSDQDVNPDDIPKPLNVEPAIGQARNPIYIPVSGTSAKDGIDSAESPSFEHLSYNAFPIGTGGKTGKGGEIVLGKPTTKHKVPLLNGGIAISPGEVITANSDIIFGRPTGIRPRIPLKSDVKDQATQENAPFGIHPPNAPLSLKPPSDYFIDSQTGQSGHSETYVGPPPPIPVPRPHEKLPNLQQSTPASIHKIPIYRGKPIFMNTKSNPNAAPSAMPPNNFKRIRAPHPDQQTQHLDIVKGPQPNIIPIQSNQNSYVLHQPGPGKNSPVHTQVYPVHHQIIDNNDIIEIQRIPEVYSTDLPPVHVYHQVHPVATPTVESVSITKSVERGQIFENHHVQFNDIQTTNVLPEIVESSTGQALLVNIQPSQMAKVVIPHGSTSALIYGGVQEAHKNGQYFDDPSPYPHGGQFVVNIANNYKHPQTNYAYPNGRPNIPHIGHENRPHLVHAPILSNQKINMDAHILSQDVNLHAPPIIFNNGHSEHENAHLSPHHYANLMHGHHQDAHSQSPNLRPPNQFNNVVYHKQGNRPSQHTESSNLYPSVDILPAHQSNIFIGGTGKHTIEQHYSGHHNQIPSNAYQYERNPSNVFDQEQKPSNAYGHDQSQPNSYNQNQVHQHSYQPAQIPFNVNIQNINEIMSSHTTRYNISDINNDPIDHSQAPSVGDEEFEDHKDADDVNENGEFIQESNNSPLLISTGSQVSKDEVEQPVVSITQTTLQPYNAQTEANSLMDQYLTYASTESTLRQTQAPQTPEPIQVPVRTTTNRNYYRPSLNPYLQIPPAVINELSSPSRYRNQPQGPKIQTTTTPSRNRNNNKIYYTGPKNERQPLLPTQDPNISNPVPSQHLKPPPPYLNIIEHKPPLAPKPSQFDQTPLTHEEQQPGSVEHQGNNGFGDKHHYKVSMPINYVTRDSGVGDNIWQTEKPFDPNNVNVVKLMPNAIHTSDAPTSTTTGTTRGTSSTTSRPETKQTTPQTTSTQRTINITSINTKITQNLFNANRGKPFIVPPPPYITSGVANGDIENLNLNTGEVPLQQKRNDTEALQEAGEIFDFKESINPHNFASVKESNEVSTMKPIDNAFDVYSKKVEKNRLKEGYNQVSGEVTYPKVPASDMQPPPELPKIRQPQQTSTTRATTLVPNRVAIEEVMGLHPPPLPPQKQPKPDIPSRPKDINDMMLSPPPVTRPVHVTYNRGSARFNTTNQENVNFQRHPPPTKNLLNTQQTTVELTTKPSAEPPRNVQYRPISRTTTKMPPTTPVKNVSIVTEALAKRPENIPKDLHVMPLNHKEIIVHTPATKGTDRPSHRDQVDNENNKHWNTNSYNHREFNNRNRFPSDILILGSEQAIVEDKATSETTSSRATPLPPTILKMNNIRPTRVEDVSEVTNKAEETSLWQNHPELNHDKMASTDLATDDQKPTESTYNRVKQILPTKYITNTKTLTVTTTKTTVIRSQGITKTLTLTLTKTQTSTIVDTITHTLLQPTRITIEPVIKPTIYTAPVAIETVSGSRTSIVADPSFSIHASTDSSVNEYNLLDREQLNKEAPDTPIIHKDVSAESVESSKKDGIEHIMPTIRENQAKSTDSIFVVMTDRKKPAIINISTDMLESAVDSNSKSTDDERIGNSGSSDEGHGKDQSSIEYDLDEDDEIFNNLPNRDEDDITKEVNHVLLGGILIASPPRSSESSKTKHGHDVDKIPNVLHNKNHYDIGVAQPGHGSEDDSESDESQYIQQQANQWQCHPECKATRNEICQRIDGSFRCACRPGFARMFPDHPCKRKFFGILIKNVVVFFLRKKLNIFFSLFSATYTYTMRLALLKNDDQILKYETALKNSASPRTSHLFEVVHDALDRMVMQSDLRDIYHGVHIVGFSTTNTMATSTERGDTSISNQADPGTGIETEFYLQLSDNSHDETHLINVFQKYLRNHNYSLGGTNIHSSKQFMEAMRASG